jgi:mono/diheme cytochrome c family protein
MRAWPFIAVCLALGAGAHAETPVERGQYLVTIAGCNDCHTPGAMLGQPDDKRRLGGSDVGFGDPASGVWVGGNLTPDKATGLG